MLLVYFPPKSREGVRKLVFETLGNTQDFVCIKRNDLNKVAPAKGFIHLFMYLYMGKKTIRAKILQSKLEN